MSDDYETVPIIHAMDIPKKSSQEFWDDWYPTWGKIKRETDNTRAELLTENRPDINDPYYKLVCLSQNDLNDIVTQRIRGACINLKQAIGRWIDMKTGTIFAINNKACKSQFNIRRTSLQSVGNDEQISFFDVLSNVPENILQHICYAGGSVKNYILGMKNINTTDHDLFVVGNCNPKEIAMKLFQHWADCEEVDIKRLFRTKQAITACFTFKDANFKIQIILRHYRSPSEVVFGFDIDAAACLYHQGRFYATPGALHSFKRMELYIDVDRLSSTGVTRYIKYWRQNGFNLCIPMSWPETYLDTFVKTRFVKSVGSQILVPTDYNCLYALFFRCYIFSTNYYIKPDIIDETVDYEETKERTKEFKATYKTMFNEWSDKVGCVLTNPNIYILYGERDCYSNMIEYIFSMPEPMIKLAELMTVPVEAEFVSVNPGTQGDIGIIQKDGRTILTGSFHPINKTWKSWAKLPRMKYCGANDSKTMNKASQDANIGYQYFPSETTIMKTRESIRESLMALIGDLTRKNIKEHLAKKDDWSLTYNTCSEALKNLSNQIPELQKVRIYNKTVSRTEHFFLGQSHLINDHYGVGTVISIDRDGVSFYMNRATIIYDHKNRCIKEYIRYVIVKYREPLVENDDSSDDNSPYGDLQDEFLSASEKSFKTQSERSSTGLSAVASSSSVAASPASPSLSSTAASSSSSAFPSLSSSSTSSSSAVASSKYIVK